MKVGYVAILGCPNAGKSTLINRILGEHLALVSAKPQSTRKRFLGIYNTPDCQILFLDTPGIQTSSKKLNQFMSHELSQAISDADVLLYVTPADSLVDPHLIDIFETVQQKTKKPSVIFLNKADLSEAKLKTTLGSLATLFFGAHCVEGSSKTGFQVDTLISTLTALLPEGELLYPPDDLTNENLRTIARELIREKAMEQLHQEIPYSLAVDLEEYKEEPHRVCIEALLIVEHESQKGMVIGSGGAMIKKIGTLARKQLEELLQSKVYLGLRVKVDKNWTKNPARLAYYGYKPD